MKPDELLLVYVLSFLATLFGLALYYDIRRKQFEPTPSADRIFRCEQCGFVYTDDTDVDRSRCPQCGTANHFIRF